MPSNFPTSLDTFPSASTLANGQLSTQPHSKLHGDLGDAVAAVQAKVGVNGSADTGSLDYLFSHFAVLNDQPNTFAVGPQTLQTGDAGNVALVVQGASSQTADLQQWIDNTGGLLAYISSNGDFVGNGSQLSGVIVLGSNVSGDIAGRAANVTGTVTIGHGGTGQTTANAALNALLPDQGSASGKFLQSNGTDASWQTAGGASSGANPSANVGLTAVNGSAATFLRSDGAPALDQGISPTWTGTHTFNNTISGSVSGNAANVTGTVTIGHGGTGQITANAALNALLPTQTSNSGLVLGTDGTNTSWVPMSTRATFALALGTPITTGTNLTNQYIVTRPCKAAKAYASAKTGPTGANLIFDINLNGTSIWNTNQANRIKINAGATSGTQTSFDTVNFVEGDIITIDCDQIGSTLAGQDITVVLLMYLS